MQQQLQLIKKIGMFFKNYISKQIAAASFSLLASGAVFAQTTPAAPAAVTGSNNMLEILLIITAVVLLLVIWGMGQVLVALSRQLMDKNKETGKIGALSVLLIVSLLSDKVMAQTVEGNLAANASANYGGVSANTFYILVAVIATEIFAILFLFFSIRRVIAELIPEKSAAAVKKSTIAALWVRLDKKLFTKAIPLEQEADALLDHNYDGIQELDNALPPWWKYGFIITICFAFVYLLNFHVLGNGKNPTEEYAAEMDKAKIAKDAYDANNKDKIDETIVPMADAAGVKIGKDYYLTNCVACHGSKGEGGAGPNLTDDYWIHKGSLNDIYHTLKVGYADKGMQSWAIKFNPKEMSEIASYVKMLKGTNPPGAKAPQGDLYGEPAPTDSLSISKQDSSTAVK
jgi:cytochrome c oxidase cbb3-type subunit 3